MLSEKRCICIVHCVSGGGSFALNLRDLEVASRILFLRFTATLAVGLPEAIFGRLHFDFRAKRMDLACDCRCVSFLYGRRWSTTSGRFVTASQSHHAAHFPKDISRLDAKTRMSPGADQSQMQKIFHPFAFWAVN